MVPEEALQYVGTVVIGEAESIWGRVIRDFEAGKMQSVYHGDRLEIKGMVSPRRDHLVPQRRQLTDVRLLTRDRLHPHPALPFFSTSLSAAAYTSSTSRRRSRGSSRR